MRDVCLVVSGMVVLFSAVSSCSREFGDSGGDVAKTKEVRLNAESDGSLTKTSYDDGGVFVWNDDERIAVRSMDRYVEFVMTEGAGTSSASFEGKVDEGVTGTYALYPYSEEYDCERTDGKKVSFTLPSKYEDYLAGRSDLPMYAAVPDIGKGDAVFHLITGALRYTISNLPAGTASLTFVTDKTICGEGKLNLEDENKPFIESLDGEQYVIYNFKTPFTGDSTVTIDVPVPAGEYKAFAVDIKDTIGRILKTVNFLKDLTMESGHIQKVSIDYAVSSAAITLPDTGLPSIVLCTPGKKPITSKADWTEGALYAIRNADGTLDAFGITAIKGRGNTTWSYPKKPYALKFEKKAGIMGMPRHKRWCLLASWMDRTSIRNAVSFEIARKCAGLKWTPRGEFAEVMLNGNHQGYYYMCEQIKVDKNRVNIAELDKSVTEGEGITGGYIMELDIYYDEVNKFKSSTCNLPWMFKDPDDINPVQFQYMEEYVNDMEAALYVDSLFAKREYERYMDLESFCDYWLVMELAANGEPSWPKSVYVHKDRNGKIVAGPVWDFDCLTYSSDFSSRLILENSLYYKRLLGDNAFKMMVRERWNKLKPSLSEIPTYVDSMLQYLSCADSINHSMWPITQTINGDEKMTFSGSMDRMKTMFLNKMKVMDEEISKW